MDKKIVTNNGTTFLLNSKESVVEAISKRLVIRNGHCPCVAEENDDTICPCKKLMTEDYCCCTLYVQEGK